MELGATKDHWAYQTMHLLFAKIVVNMHTSYVVPAWKTQCTCSIVGRLDGRIWGAYHELCKTAP